MKSIFTKCTLIVLMVFLLVGCANIEDSISKDDAKRLVIDYHTNNTGSPSILSIELKGNAYYVKWEKKENKEFGIDKVTKDGEIKTIEATIE